MRVKLAVLWSQTLLNLNPGLTASQVGDFGRFLKYLSLKFTHLKMGIVTLSPHMAVLRHTYDNICKMFSTMLAVVVILLLITLQISELNHLLVLPHSVDTQIL